MRPSDNEGSEGVRVVEGSEVVRVELYDERTSHMVQRIRSPGYRDQGQPTAL